MDFRYIARIGSRILLFVVLISVIGVMCYHIAAGSTDTVESIEVSEGTINSFVRTSAVVVRSERVISWETPDVCLFNVENGEKIPSGSTVGSLYANSAENREKIDRIAKTDKSIYILESAQNLESSYSLSSADKQISALRLKLSEYTASGDVAACDEISEQLQIMMNVKLLKNGYKKNFKSEIASLRSERNEIVSSLGEAETTVKTGVSGVLYTSCDGYEEVYGGVNVTSLDIDGLRELCSAGPLDAGGGRCKLVTDHNWYVVAPIERRELENFVSGKRYDVKFSDGTVNMKLVKTVSSNESETAYLILTYDKDPDGFEISRKSTVEIIYKKSSGYMIPVSSLRQLDGYTGVYALHGSVVKFRRVSVIESDGTYTVCDPDFAPTEGAYKSLKFYDRIITKGKDLYDGKIID